MGYSFRAARGAIHVKPIRILLLIEGRSRQMYSYLIKGCKFLGNYRWAAQENEWIFEKQAEVHHRPMYGHVLRCRAYID